MSKARIEYTNKGDGKLVKITNDSWGFFNEILQAGAKEKNIEIELIELTK